MKKLILFSALKIHPHSSVGTMPCQCRLYAVAKNGLLDNHSITN